MFLPCVLVTSAHEPRGGARFFNFFWPNTGGRASSAKFFCETRGANGRHICCPPFFWAEGRILGLFPVAVSSRAGTAQKEAKEEEEEEEDEGGEE